MKQDKINYDQIIKLGFNESIEDDSVFFAEYGFAYTIITLKLTKKIYLDWEKETQFCKIVRIDSPKTGNIKKQTPIKNLEQLKEIINFYSDKEEEVFDHYHCA